MIDLRQHPQAVVVQKLPIPVSVRFALSDGVCETLEGDVAYKEGAAIMTGVSGEHWPIERYKFEASYDAIAPTQLGQDGWYFKKPIRVLAWQLTEPMQVTVGWKDSPLNGKIGDWLLQYADNDYGIVSGDIFLKSYQIMTIEHA
jgi:hypothetical protein